MSTPKLTPRQAAILGAYTGIPLGHPVDLHAYAEEKLGRPLNSALELGYSQTVWDELKRAALPDLKELYADGRPQAPESRTAASGSERAGPRKIADVTYLDDPRFGTCQAIFTLDDGSELGHKASYNRATRSFVIELKDIEE